MDTSELEPSKLGTKEHWDNVYEEELENFGENGDEGEIWFGKKAMNEMVKWVNQHVPSRSDISVLEVGSGNGALLFALAEGRGKACYPAHRLLGIDYSEGAVQLAQSVAHSRNLTAVTFRVCDFLHEDPPLLADDQKADQNEAWDLILDKGTYDAIALMEKDKNGRTPVEGYPIRIAKLLNPGGHFLITSCNFTDFELKSKFITEETGLQYHSSIEHPTISFGGSTGSACSSVAFTKSA
ncbi:S-adenosyl-L-methionine-dependent methyltransferase [Suillus fuscotomentosus]|uniref:Protein-lysine N-methyltransferase EFM4 n=1 Tax=Suillus fuscotomentosus TaxID=1912939 RepID=A0AAD4HS16_9AGAM|nr:S-adenosyl-L-methionine-dependent methyltransferase [Suillus fuscotomentosus]KAG1905459.1 S-adenosyl-L-methionine-dependent methyltransferase [Suillus fuscotomentosus]